MNDATPPQATALTPSLSRSMIDATLLPLLAKRAHDAHRISPHYQTLWQDIQTLYTAGGKRLRSYMTLLAFEAYSKQRLETILPIAAAQELLHTAMLIHDDIIDRDDTRYGVKNISGRYMNHYKTIIDDDDNRRHYAHGAALLAGDLLISEAYSLTSQSDIDAKMILAAQSILSHTIFNAAGGELLDTEAAFRGSDAADPLVIATYKTASYSFVSPLLIGATLAQAPDSELALLQEFGESLGTAYQLRDDLIGVFGDRATSGKSDDSDLQEAKRTFLIETFRTCANKTDLAAFDSLFGRQSLEPGDIRTLKTLLQNSGAVDIVESKIETYRIESVALLDTLTISKHHHEALRTLIDRCVQRDT